MNEGSEGAENREPSPEDEMHNDRVKAKWEFQHYLGQKICIDKSDV